MSSFDVYSQLFYAMPPEWRSSNEVKAALRSLDYNLLKEEGWLPGFGLVMAPFHLLPSPSLVKVVVLGHEPSPIPGAANGLAFGLKEAFDDEQSRLRRIQKVLFGEEVDQTMRGLALEGVLLLNTCLSNDGESPGSHRYLGWRNFIRAILAQVPTNTVTWKLGSEARRNGYNTPSTYVFSENLPMGLPKDYQLDKAYYYVKLRKSTNNALAQMGYLGINWANQHKRG